MQKWLSFFDSRWVRKILRKFYAVSIGACWQLKSHLLVPALFKFSVYRWSLAVDPCHAALKSLTLKDKLSLDCNQKALNREWIISPPHTIKMQSKSIDDRNRYWNLSLLRSLKANSRTSRKLLLFKAIQGVGNYVIFWKPLQYPFYN